MIRNLLACTTALAYCMITSPAARASPPVHVHLGRQGSVTRSTLVRRLGLGPGSSLEPTTTLKTMRGTMAERNRQEYRGIPVFGCSVVIERDAKGEVLGVDGRVARDLAAQIPSIRPSIPPARAVRILRAKLGLDVNTPIRQVEHTLYVDPRGTTPVLAYHVSFFMPGRFRPQHPTALIDARDGHVIDLWRGLSTQSGALPARPASLDAKPATTTHPGGAHD